MMKNVLGVCTFVLDANPSGSKCACRRQTTKPTDYSPVYSISPSYLESRLFTMSPHSQRGR